MKINFKSLKFSQIQFKNKSKHIKEIIERAQIKNKNNISINKTNDSSIPEERIREGILSGKIFDLNLTLKSKIKRFKFT